MTTTGSVPRPPQLARLLEAAASGAADPAAIERGLADATAAAVAWQRRCGVDVVSDGEVARRSVLDARQLGFDGPPVPFPLADLADTGTGQWAPGGLACPGTAQAPSNTREIAYDPGPAAARIARFRKALDDLGSDQPAGAFLAAPSPGLATLAGTSYYRDPREFLAAAAAALAHEYRAITDAGLMLQVDAPDLTLPYHAWCQGMPVEEFRTRARLQAEHLNRALAGIDPQQVRLHICWGNYPGPHHRDLPLAVIIDILYSVHAGTLVLAGATAQHRADWRVFATRKLPAGTTLAAGLIDTTDPGVETPVAIADALVAVAGVTGPDRLLAATDCGFAGFPGAPALPARIAELKVQALKAGADMATRRLWRGDNSATA